MSCNKFYEVRIHKDIIELTLFNKSFNIKGKRLKRVAELLLPFKKYAPNIRITVEDMSTVVSSNLGCCITLVGKNNE